MVYLSYQTTEFKNCNFICKGENDVHIITELMNNGKLQDYLLKKVKPFSEDESKLFFIHSKY